METDSQSELSSTEVPGLPEVIIDGHRVAPGSKDALGEVYEIINMANIAKMRKRMDDQAAQGWVVPYRINVIADGEEFWLKKPGQAITLINDGPAAVQLGINDRIQLQTINLNQTFNLNFGNHTLAWFFLRCAAGAVAVVRAEVKG